MATRRTFPGAAAVWCSDAIIDAHQHTAAASQEALYAFQSSQHEEIAIPRTVAGSNIPVGIRPGWSKAAHPERYSGYFVGVSTPVKLMKRREL